MKSVDAVTLRKKLGQYVNEAYYRGDEFVIKRAGKPIAALVPLEDLKGLIALKNQGLKTLRKIWASNKNVPLETIQKDVAEAIRAVRRRH